VPGLIGRVATLENSGRNPSTECRHVAESEKPQAPADELSDLIDKKSKFPPKVRGTHSSHPRALPPLEGDPRSRFRFALLADDGSI